MKINRKNKIILLSTVTALAVVCGTVALGLGATKNNKQVTTIPKVAKIASDTGEKTSFNKCCVVKENRNFNYIEIQTWEFEYITINFLENSMDNFSFKKGESINILNLKKEKRNGAMFYFADRNTEIEVNKFTEEINTKPSYIPQKDNLVEQIQEETKSEDYNYKRDAD